MKYTHLSLDDFGCFTHAQIRNIDDGLTVIAGPQRAGKTTFMQALRALPYGISTGDSVPPATNEYRLGGMFEHNGGQYDLTLDGYSDPTVAAQEGSPDLTLGDFHGTVTKQRYQQLFTLSLDELQRLPEGVEDEEDLSEILLGAAYQDVAAIPEVRDRFDSTAKGIAGKNGNKSYDIRPPLETIEQAVENRTEAKQSVDRYEETKVDLERIDQGIRGARRTIDRRKKEKARLELLDNRFDTLTSYQEIRSKLADSSDVLELDEPEDIIGAAEQLETDLEETQQELTTTGRSICDATDLETDDPEAVSETILEHAEDLESYRAQVEKWRQQEEDLIDAEDTLNDEQRELEQRVTNLKRDWDGDLDEPMGVTIDQVSRDQVRETIEDVRAARDRLATAWEDLKNERTRLAGLQEEQSDLKDQLSEEADRNSTEWRDSIKSATVSGGGIAAVGVLLGTVIAIVGQPIIGGLAALLGLIGGLWYIRQEVDGTLDSQEPALDTESLSQVKSQISILKGDLKDTRRTFSEAVTDVHDAERRFRNLTASLELPRDLSPRSVRSFYEDLDELQKDIQEYRDDRRVLKDERAGLEADLTTAATTTQELTEFTWNDDDPLAHSDRLYGAIQDLADVIDDARRFERANSKLDSLRVQTIDLIEDWDDSEEVDERDTEGLLRALEQYREEAERTAEYQEMRERFGSLRDQLTHRFDSSSVVAAFEPFCRDDGIEMEPLETNTSSKALVQDGGERRQANSLVSWPIEALESLVDQYPTRNSIRERIDDIEGELKTLENEISDLQEKQAEKRQELKEYGSDADIRAAQATIDEARRKFERLYEEYAINRIGQELTQRLYHRFMDEATGPLLEDASEIFREITGAYDGIGHDGELTELEFQALQDDGPDHDIGALSRATAEQLFLALRLARIRQFDTSLPVVVDDAMTNFDPNHARRTLAFLDDLAETNQVFLTTCHPETLELVDEQVSNPTYYTLAQGHFDERASSPEAAIALLQGEDTA